MSVNEEDTRDLGDLEYLIQDQEEYDNCASLVSDEDAVFRSIPMSSGPMEVDFRSMSGGMGFEGVGILKQSPSLSHEFAKEYPHLQSKATTEKSIFHDSTLVSTPPVLDPALLNTVSKTTIFCKSSSTKKVVDCVRNLIEKNLCFERLTRNDDLKELASPEGNEWIWNLTHFSHEKFSIDMDVMFWVLDDNETFCQTFPFCPKDANFAIEFQRLGGDSFAWMDLWSELSTDIENIKENAICFVKNGKVPKRRRFDDDLLSDCEDDGPEEVNDTLAMLIRMYQENALEGKLEGLQTMCRMCDNSEHCKLMAKNVNFLEFVVSMFEEIRELCSLSCRPMPLLRCVISLLLNLVSMSGKSSILTGEKTMRLIASVLEDMTCCLAARYECAKVVFYLISHGVSFENRDTVLEAVSVASSNTKSRLLVEITSKINQTLRSLSYR